MNVWGDSKEGNRQPTNTIEIFNQSMKRPLSKRVGLLESLPLLASLLFNSCLFAAQFLPPLASHLGDQNDPQRWWYVAFTFIMAMTYLIISRVWILIHFPWSFWERDCWEASCVTLISGAKNVTLCTVIDMLGISELHTEYVWRWTLFCDLAFWIYASSKDYTTSW